MKRALVIALIAAGGCYNPAIPDGELRCASGDVCPDGYYCAADNTCWHNGATPDLSSSGDGGNRDGGTDGSTSSDGGATLLVANGHLSNISPDETLMAWFTSTMVMGPQTVGALTLSAIATPSTPILTDSNAFEPIFSLSGTNDALYYFSNATFTTDTGSNAVYGSLKVWTPSMSAPATVTSGFATFFAAAQDNSFIIFFDAGTASATATGNIVLVRAADCSGTTCQPIMLESSVVMDPLGFITSNDNHYAGYNAKAGGTYTTYLADVAAGTASTIVGSAANPPSRGFTTDGTLFAAGTTALKVVSTSNATTVTWGALVTGTQKLQELIFADSQTICFRALDISNMEWVYRVGPTGTATQLTTATVQSFQLPRGHTTTSTGRYLFANTTATNGVGDLQLYDLQASTPTPTQLATSADLSTVLVSNDQTLAVFNDHFDTADQHGTVTSASLPTGTPVVLGTNVASLSLSFAGDEIWYTDPGNSMNTLTVVANGQTKGIVTGVNVYRIRQSPAPTLYFSNATTDTILGLAPGIYSMPQP